MNDAGTLLVEGDQGDGHDPRALLWDAERQQLTLLWDGTGEYVYPLGLNAQQDFAYQRGSIAFFRSRSGDERQIPDLGGRYLLNGGTPPMLVGAPAEPTGHVAWVWTEGAGA